MRITGVALLSVIASVAQAQDSAPLDTRNHRTLSLPFLRLNPLGNPLPAGSREWSVTFVSANDLRNEVSGQKFVLEDVETERLSVRYRWDLGHHTTATVELPFLARGGGFMDPLIDVWHQYVVGYRGSIRDNAAYGRSEVIVPGAGRFGSSAGIGDITLRADRAIAPRWVAQAAIKLPTGDASKLFGSGAFDAAVGVSRSVPLSSRWSLWLSASAVVQGKATRLPNSRSFVDQESASVVFQANSRDTYIGQIQAETSATRTGVAASDRNHRITSIGYRRKVSETQSFELYFTENRDWPALGSFYLNDVGPDFTAGLRWTTKF